MSSTCVSIVTRKNSSRVPVAGVALYAFGEGPSVMDASESFVDLDPPVVFEHVSSTCVSIVTSSDDSSSSNPKGKFGEYL